MSDLGSSAGGCPGIAWHSVSGLVTHPCHATANSVFTRALALVKLDPRSLDLWRAYIKYLVSKDDVTGVLRAYKEALVVPQAYADSLLPEFEAFVASKPTTALVTPEQRAVRHQPPPPARLWWFDASLSPTVDVAWLCGTTGYRDVHRGLQR